MINTDILRDGAKSVHYDVPGIPVSISRHILSEYPGNKTLLHWHEDAEWVLVLEGSMNCHVNGKAVILEQNDILMLRPDVLHYEYGRKNDDCLYTTVMFDPEILKSNELIYTECIAPILDRDIFPYIHINLRDREYGRILDVIKKIIQDKENAIRKKTVPDFLMLMSELYELMSLTGKVNEGSDDMMLPEDISGDDVNVQKQMISYIREYYPENLTLDDIAGSAGISVSTCCRIFKKYLNQSPVDYLNAFRMETAKYLLETTTYPVGEIASSCGFKHMSYFSKEFRLRYNKTPKEVRT